VSARNRIGGQAAIAGIGATAFTKESGRSEMSLACEAVIRALDDAGLTPADVDGFACYSAENNPEIEIARSIGVGELTFFGRVHHGGGAACGTVHQAAMAVATGAADVVVCYRAFNERSGRRFGAGVQDLPNQITAERAQFSWYAPFGLLTPASWVAMVARRYMHDYGATSLDFGRVAVADRRHAANNPNAFFHGQPITLEIGRAHV
jgi:acetyl-CoA acetyltransferase